MSLDRYICIHGHFYQPPRENPWLEEIEAQDSAYPYHDWNERITAECYDPNRASRVLDTEGMIVAIVNNYAKMSFDFGPTLLSWMERHSPETYEAILEADRMSMKNFSGHGSALAQVYNHVIMPLANGRDKLTQIVWGIKDFEHRFKRPPEGMWLPELAFDIPTLEIVADRGITFIILAPRQAKKVKKPGRGSRWSVVNAGAIDPTMPYFCRLPSGRSLSIFFYDAPIARDVAFGGLLRSGEELGRRLAGAFSNERKHPQLVHIATDGETFGHHHRGGDMALTFCMQYIESQQWARITNYGEHLEKHPPTHEVSLLESTSWSCVHGIERWRDNCGCRAGVHPGWTQEWRKPLREALDEIRFYAIGMFERGTRAYFPDPWAVRNDYISVVLDRSEETMREFLRTRALQELSPQEEILLLGYLEMQRNAMLMYTSCGWFFDEISGIEAVQILRYAAKVMQLAEDLTGENLETDFLATLEAAPSNVYGNGAEVYLQFARPSRIDLPGIAARYIISSLYEDYPEKTSFYCYIVENRERRVWQDQRQMLVVGKLGIRSQITLKEATLIFAGLRSGTHGITAGVREFIDDEDYSSISESLVPSFGGGDYDRCASLIERHFPGRIVSFDHLSCDDQKRIIKKITSLSSDLLYTLCREIYTGLHDSMELLRERNVPLLKPFTAAAEHVAGRDLRRFFEEDGGRPESLEALTEEIKKWPLEVDADRSGRIASARITALMHRLSLDPSDSALAERVEAILRQSISLNLKPDLFKAQNIYCAMGKRIAPAMKDRREEGQREREKWLNSLRSIGLHLKVKPPF